MRSPYVSSIVPFVAFLMACGADPAMPPRPAKGPAPAIAGTTTAPPRASTAPATVAPRRLTVDTTITSASGASFLAPAGWWVTERVDAVVLEDPERAVKTTILETPEADGVKAIDASWQRVAPGFALKIKNEPESPPPVRGWDSVTNVDYETNTEDHRAVQASARRYGATTYVALIDGELAAASRRGAQLRTALLSFRPKGMHDESFDGKTPRPIDEARAKELDTFIAQAFARLAVPGAAVAVVQGGKVVYEKGFGVRALGAKQAVTPNTLFMIGSITKSMTTMMQASLVDAGKLGWDTPVTKLLPTFALGDPELTNKLVLWHTACACTGLPRQDMELLFEFGHVSPEERMAAMRTMKPTTAFGETFQYSNSLVAVGGFAAAHAFDPKRSLGDAYDAAMQKTVFGPIGMKSTTLDFGAAMRADHAMPHGDAIDGVVHAIPLEEEHFVTPLRPAGGVWSNVRDMERYVMTEMAKGLSPDGKRVVSEANLLERRKMRVRASDVAGYGLGLVVGTFRGLPALSHTGGTFGFLTSMFMLPEQGIAVVSLTNATSGDDFNSAVQRKVVEELFDGAKDQAAAIVDFSVKAKRDTVAKMLEKLNRDPEAAWVKQLAGAYTNASLGKVRITPGAGAKGGVFDAGEWKSHIAQQKEDSGVVKVVLIDPPATTLELVVGGDATHPTLTLMDDQVRYVFEREAK